MQLLCIIVVVLLPYLGCVGLRIQRVVVNIILLPRLPVSHPIALPALIIVSAPAPASTLLAHLSLLIATGVFPPALPAPPLEMSIIPIIVIPVTGLIAVTLQILPAQASTHQDPLCLIPDRLHRVGSLIIEVVCVSAGLSGEEVFVLVPSQIECEHDIATQQVRQIRSKFTQHVPLE